VPEKDPDLKRARDTLPLGLASALELLQDFVSVRNASRGLPSVPELWYDFPGKRNALPVLPSAPELLGDLGVNLSEDDRCCVSLPPEWPTVIPSDPDSLFRPCGQVGHYFKASKLKDVQEKRAVIINLEPKQILIYP
jgi:hypothetical protein